MLQWIINTKSSSRPAGCGPGAHNKDLGYKTDTDLEFVSVELVSEAKEMDNLNQKEHVKRDEGQRAENQAMGKNDQKSMRINGQKDRLAIYLC